MANKKTKQIRKKLKSNQTKKSQFTARKVMRQNHYQEQNGKCFYCKKALNRREATLDHVIPVSKGGMDTKENTVMCCKTCNILKSNQSNFKLSWFQKILLRLFNKS